MYKFIYKIFIIFFIILFTCSSVLATDEIYDGYEEEPLTDSDVATIIQTSSTNTQDLQINARHAVIFDRASNQVIYGKKETEQCKMASTTKILTAILTLENVKLDEIVTVSSRTAHAPKSRIGLSTNDKISVNDLLYGLMLYSGNDAAVALAEYVGRKC